MNVSTEQQDKFGREIPHKVNGVEYPIEEQLIQFVGKGKQMSIRYWLHMYARYKARPHTDEQNYSNIVYRS